MAIGKDERGRGGLVAAVVCCSWLFATAVLAGQNGVELIRVQAEAGDAEGQFKLGLRYANGDGVLRDYREAADWFRRAADQGRADAQSTLASLYLAGLGVSQDHREVSAVIET